MSYHPNQEIELLLQLLKQTVVIQLFHFVFVVGDLNEYK